MQNTHTHTHKKHRPFRPRKNNNEITRVSFSITGCVCIVCITTNNNGQSRSSRQQKRWIERERKLTSARKQRKRHGIKLRPILFPNIYPHNHNHHYKHTYSSPALPPPFTPFLRNTTNVVVKEESQPSTLTHCVLLYQCLLGQKTAMISTPIMRRRRNLDVNFTIERENRD